MTAQPSLFDQVDPEQIGGGRSQANHPWTSHRAALVVRSGTQQAALLCALAAASDGLTCWEARPMLERVRPGISPNQIGARMGELHERGLVVEAHEATGRVATRLAAKSPAVVWVTTAAGSAEAHRLAAL
jgi:hypothetical protein